MDICRQSKSPDPGHKRKRATAAEGADEEAKAELRRARNRSGALRATKLFLQQVHKSFWIVRCTNNTSTLNSSFALPTKTVHTVYCMYTIYMYVLHVTAPLGCVAYHSCQMPKVGASRSATPRLSLVQPCICTLRHEAHQVKMMQYEQ